MVVLHVDEADPARPASLVCSACGYGIARPDPPGPCPMCRQEGAWAASHRRPFADRPPT